MNRLKLPCVWLELNLGGERIAVINIYREFKKYKTVDAAESENIREQKARFWHFIEEWSTRRGSYDEMFVMGDLNIDFNTARYKPFIDMLNKRILNKGFHQIIKKPTLRTGLLE